MRNTDEQVLVGLDGWLGRLFQIAPIYGQHRMPSPSCHSTVGRCSDQVIMTCRALNQAIGRCIRHKHDYGGIILLDRRFGDVRNRKDLSCW